MKSHQDFGETFPEWKLYESARACQHLMSKRPGFLDTLTSDMAEFADFTHARLSNSVVLQCLQTVFTSIVSTIYDGMSSEDMDLLLLECCKLCVHRQPLVSNIASSCALAFFANDSHLFWTKQRFCVLSLFCPVNLPARCHIWPLLTTPHGFSTHLASGRLFSACLQSCLGAWCQASPLRACQPSAARVPTRRAPRRSRRPRRRRPTELLSQSCLLSQTWHPQPWRARLGFATSCLSMI